MMGRSEGIKAAKSMRYNNVYRQPPPPINEEQQAQTQRIIKALETKDQSILFGINKSFIPSNSIFKEPVDERLSIREQSLKFFEDIIGNDDVKEQTYRSLLQTDRIINICLVGAPATSKTMLLKVINDKCNKVLWYDASSGSTGAGLIELLRRNQDAKILIIDEISELRGGNLDILRGLLNDGNVSKTLKSQFINFKMKGLKVFASTNNPTKLSLPIKSRFQMYLIDSYDDEQFVNVMEFCLLKQKIIKSEQMAKELAYAMLHYDVRNVRTALSLCSLVHESDTTDDIRRVIENYLINDASKVNTNFNEVEG